MGAHGRHEPALPSWAALAGDPEAWEIAEREFRDGRPDKLGELVSAYLAQPVAVERFIGAPPVGLAELAGAAIAGRARPDGRRSNARKSSPGARDWALFELERVREHRRLWTGERLEVWAERERIETAEARRRVDRIAGEAEAEIAKRAGVTRGTLKQWAKSSRDGKTNRD
jgi:hypothetical protein